MNAEERTAVFDKFLQIEAYSLKGVAQPFPPHFHEYYVVGFIESGERRLVCGGTEYSAKAGDVLLFNPGDTHSCAQSGTAFLDYRAVNVSTEVMERIAEEIFGKKFPPKFSRPVLTDREIFCSLKKLLSMILDGGDCFEKEELLFLAFSQLLSGGDVPEREYECSLEIEDICTYMGEHFPEKISVADLCELTALSKATLIRSFTREKGISPYRYLENIRLGAAKRLLEKGVPPVTAAMETGFSDQSHFTNFFKDYIGLTPKQYANIFKD
ncbi:MAG: AraC family transcriptional regulator [Muribaculaceae bacterium]|nr:AraC family transcriptional regulator [Muribaculaceae bacterium]MCM1478370.1 AraC family transcriptional regulator [Muribaculaceae bacterium]